MKRFEVIISLGTLALTTVLLAALWHTLADVTLHHKAGVGKAPFNHPDSINKVQP